MPVGVLTNLQAGFFGQSEYLPCDLGLALPLPDAAASFWVLPSNLPTFSATAARMKSDLLMFEASQATSSFWMSSSRSLKLTMVDLDMPT